MLDLAPADSRRASLADRAVGATWSSSPCTTSTRRPRRPTPSLGSTHGLSATTLRTRGCRRPAGAARPPSECPTSATGRRRAGPASRSTAQPRVHHRRRAGVPPRCESSRRWTRPAATCRPARTGAPPAPPKHRQLRRADRDRLARGWPLRGAPGTSPLGSRACGPRPAGAVTGQPGQVRGEAAEDAGRPLLLAGLRAHHDERTGEAGTTHCSTRSWRWAEATSAGCSAEGSVPTRPAPRGAATPCLPRTGCTPSRRARQRSARS